MQRAHRRGLIVGIMSLLVSLVAAIGGAGTGPATARAVSIECTAPPAQVVATPSASPVSIEPEIAPFPDGGGDLTVFAAASLTDSFNEIKTQLETANPGLTITYNFAGSAALVTQLSEGAAADVVALASKKQIDAAAEHGLLDGESTLFAQNRLTLVVPADNPGGIDSLADLSRDGVKLVLAAAEVPVGQYARESLCKMGNDSATYGDGFVQHVAANIVSEEDNVKAVLAKVQLGEADAGIVYTTDVTEKVVSDVKVLEIPAAVNVVAKYPIAAIKGGQGDLAAAFIAYVLGPDGQAVLESYGFEPKP